MLVKEKQDLLVVIMAINQKLCPERFTVTVNPQKSIKYYGDMGVGKKSRDTMKNLIVLSATWVGNLRLLIPSLGRWWIPPSGGERGGVQLHYHSGVLRV